MRTTEITEDNDPNNLIGRPNGYTAAYVIEDSRIGCPEPPDKIGVDCGAMVEQWPDQASAQARADYIQRVRKDLPMLGQEYYTVRGDLLLRVSGELKPSQAEAYERVLVS
ncbi:hypothetical protein RD149_13125 [Gordonia westfalica]|uniref:Uncharacterized protein n=1 Tax=Gordonia westfalica TaxID=158898 RepID=A0ABU2GTC9_9ACTN|nr:hypothetical protein [Gordonia westfalica]MDS1114711.1 hypothetical protein [Gordonia westfalica]